MGHVPVLIVLIRNESVNVGPATDQYCANAVTNKMRDMNGLELIIILLGLYSWGPFKGNKRVPTS